MPRLELDNLNSKSVGYDNIDAILEEVLEARSSGETRSNYVSSRSHAIFRIEQENGRVITVVDLAGSEKFEDGENPKESCSINKSLLTLGRCIKSLGEQKSEGSLMIPFRESRLTKALAEYFTDQYLITMIITVNPQGSSISDTKKVLEYAAIAKSVSFLQPSRPQQFISEQSKQDLSKKLKIKRG